MFTSFNSTFTLNPICFFCFHLFMSMVCIVVVVVVRFCKYDRRSKCLQLKMENISFFGSFSMQMNSTVQSTEGPSFNQSIHTFICIYKRSKTCAYYVYIYSKFHINNQHSNWDQCNSNAMDLNRSVNYGLINKRLI